MALSMEWTPRLVTASMCQSGDVSSPLTEGASNMKVKAVGIDLAKNVFQIHCVDEQGKVLLRKQLMLEMHSRKQTQKNADPIVPLPPRS